MGSGIDLGLLDQIRHLLRPLSTRIANTIARGVVQLVNDETKMQLVQLGVLDGETVEGDKGAENFQAYGFSSVPIVGAEAVVIFPNGDRAHPLMIATSDRRYRPTGGEPGQVGLHHYLGAKITMLKNGDIEIQPGPGGQVFVRDAGGSAEPLVRKSEHDGHTHPALGLTAPSGGGPVTGTTGGAAAVDGTQRLQSQ